MALLPPAPTIPALDLRAEIERAAFGAQHLLVVAALALATLFDGYDVFVPAYVIPYARNSWHLLPSEAGLLVSSGLIGFMIGSLLNGPIADRLGRKPTLLTALLLAALFNLVTALWARSYVQFLAARLLTGIGLGMILPLCVTLINEIAPRRTANVLVGWVMAGWSVGGIGAALAGLALTPTPGWPALFMVGAIAGPLAALFTALLPESPRFLALKQREGAVRGVMCRLVPARAAAYARSRFTLAEGDAHRGSFARLLVPALRRGTFVVWGCSGLSLFAIFGLSSWTPQMMLERGMALGASFGLGALLQLSAVLGGIGCGWLADRMGREPTLVASWTCGAAAVAGLAVLNLPATNVLLLALAGFCVMGAQPVLNNRTAALYDTEIRSTGVGAQLGVGRLGGILGPYIGGWLQQIVPGSTALFVCMACAVGGCALCIRLLPRAPAGLNR
jgi:AAHS family 4-hydroxybenzoate transporter-like MFS transporter